MRTPLLIRRRSPSTHTQLMETGPAHGLLAWLLNRAVPLLGLIRWLLLWPGSAADSRFPRILGPILLNIGAVIGAPGLVPLVLDGTSPPYLVLRPGLKETL